MSKYGFTIDTNQCVGCRSCEMACKTEYGIQAGQGRRRRVIDKTVDEGSGNIRTFFISLACNHCDSPACIASCPKSLASGTGTSADSALWKDDASGTNSNGLGGVVHYEASHCIGCRRCEWACPYGQPQFDPDSGTIHKCELCYQRIGAWKTAHGAGEDPVNPSGGAGSLMVADKRRQPACVATCMGRAISMQNLDIAAGVANIGPTGTPTGGIDFADQHPLTSGANAVNPSTRNTRAFNEAGDAGRGSSYLADKGLCAPNVRICNRVYKNRDGVAS